MKKIIILAVALIMIILTSCGNRGSNSTGGSASDTGSTGSGQIVFREYQHDFGKVAEGEKLSYTFTFDNKGTSDIVISSASTSCGCTIPKYERKPIHPGANGTLEVVFDTSGRNGTQTKTITVKSNASTPVVLLKITAEVITNDK